MTENSTPSPRFVIEQPLLQGVLEYLSQRPYFEVAHAINELRALPTFIPENATSGEAQVPRLSKV